MRKVSRHGIQGATFGVMEGTVMMLGVLLGLSVTGDRFIIVLGLLTAGIADAFANSSSFYVSEESEMIHTRAEVWKAAKLCFLATLGVVALMTVPLLAIRNTSVSMIVSVAVGLVVLFVLGIYMAKKLKSKTPSSTVIKYVLIGTVTAVACFIIGELLEYIAPVF